MKTTPQYPRYQTAMQAFKRAIDELKEEGKDERARTSDETEGRRVEDTQQGADWAKVGKDMAKQVREEKVDG